MVTLTEFIMSQRGEGSLAGGVGVSPIKDPAPGVEPIDQIDDQNSPNQNDPVDPSRQGLIRTIPKAHLIYKRETDDGTFEELWIFNISNVNDERRIKQTILADTDIPDNELQSADGQQTYTLWTIGNASILNIKGLPS